MNNLQPDGLTGAEALLSFFAWLTTRAETVTLGADHDQVGPAELVGKFLAVNNLTMPADDSHLERCRWPAEPEPAPGPEPMLGDEPAEPIVRTPLGMSDRYAENAGLCGEPTPGGPCRKPAHIPAGEAPSEPVPFKDKASDRPTAELVQPRARGPLVQYGETVMDCCCSAPLPGKLGTWHNVSLGWTCKGCGRHVPRASLTPDQLSDLRKMRGQFAEGI